MRSAVRVGSEGSLRVRFLDAAGEPVEATSVTVDLFEPELDPDVDPPTVAGLVPTYLGNGVFEVTFTATAPGGRWLDQWTGTILGTETISVQQFTVLSDGVIVTYPLSGLNKNTLVEVTLPSTISDIDGNTLGDDYTFFFTTTYDPLYSSVRKVRLAAGGLLKTLPEDVINLAILEASLEADIINFNKNIINQKLFEHARREFVTCSASNILAQNVLANGGVIRSKMLADFKVDYDVNVLGDLLNTVNDCIKKWEGQVQSGGGTRTLRSPQMVIKGENDPDRPAVGRHWHSMQQGELPVGNTKLRASGTRRWKTGWLARNSRKPGSDW